MLHFRYTLDNTGDHRGLVTDFAIGELSFKKGNYTNESAGLLDSIGHIDANTGYVWLMGNLKANHSPGLYNDADLKILIVKDTRAISLHDGEATSPYVTSATKVNIYTPARTTIISMLNSAHNIRTDDLSEPANEKRKIPSINSLEGIQFVASLSVVSKSFRSEVKSIIAPENPNYAKTFERFGKTVHPDQSVGEIKGIWPDLIGYCLAKEHDHD